MASKLASFLKSRRILPIPITFHFFYSAQTLIDPNPDDFDSAVRSLRNGLHPRALVRVLDAIPDPISAVDVFRWASRQSKFSHTPETYARLVVRLGAVGNCGEMEVFAREMVSSLRTMGGVEELDSVVVELCWRRRIAEAIRVFEIVRSAERMPSISACNVLLGTIVAERWGFEDVVFVYKEMVKGGSAPDVETLNCLIEGLVEMGRMDTTLWQFRRMRKKGCVPNARTFEVILNGLCVRGLVDESVEVLDEFFKSECSPDSGFYCKIVPLLCEFGRLKEGFRLFKMMRSSQLVPDLILVRTLIRCLCDNGEVGNAVEIFDEMIEMGITPIVDMFVDIVNGFSKMGKLSEAWNFLERNQSFDSEPYNMLLRGYCDVHMILEALVCLDKMVEIDVADDYSWGILISALCKSGSVKKTFEVFCRMIVSSYVPREATHSALITAYTEIKLYKDALKCFQHICCNNWSLDSKSYGELVSGLCHVKKFREAAKVFYYMHAKGDMLNTVSLNLLINGVCLTKRINEALHVRSLSFCSGTYSDASTFSIIIMQLLERSKSKYCLTLFSQMLVEGCKLDTKTYCLLLHGLCAESMTREIPLLLDQMISDGFVPDSRTANILISSMSEHSRLHLLLNGLIEIFKREAILTSATCNLIVVCLLREGHKHDACVFVDLMLEKGWIPDAETHVLLVEQNYGESVAQLNEVQGTTNEDKVVEILEEGLLNTN